jgi:hypothetical protein
MQKKERKKKPSVFKSLLQFYVFLWPTIRTYFMWFKYFKTKKKRHKKEKIEIIEE